MRLKLWIVVAILVLCRLVALFLRPIGLAWGRFWHAVLMWRYLGVPWAVARDRARRRGL